MYTASMPTTNRAPAGFPLAIRDYLKRTALLMEIENHKKPFFPGQSKVVEDAHLALYEQIGATFPADVDVFVCVVLRKDDPETHAATAVCSYSDRTGEITKILVQDEPVLGEATFDVYRYLHDAATTRTSETGRNVRSAITDWLDGNNGGHFYIAPYVVSAVDDERIENFRKGSSDVRIGERFLPPIRRWTDLLQTVAFAIDSNPASTLPTLMPATYFTAAMLVGVREWGIQGEPADLATILEALFIQYQLAWSFPTLIDQRKAHLEKQNTLQAQEIRLSDQKWQQTVDDRALRERQAAFKVVEGIAKTMAVETKKLQALLDPFEAPLLSRYRLPGRFIADEPSKPFWHWLFEHNWPVAVICERPDHFRQQFACILLAYCSPGSLPDRYTGRWPDQPVPSLLLRTFRDHVPRTFVQLFAETIDKVVRDDLTVEWTIKDETAFQILKAACFNPFKHQRKLTGPLLALWAEEHGHSVSAENIKLLTNTKSARDGDGWCRVEALDSLHNLITLGRSDTKYPQNTLLSVIVSPLLTGIRATGAKVQIVKCLPDFVKHVENLQTPSDEADIGADEFFGDLTKAVMGIFKWCTPMKAEAEGEYAIGEATACLTVFLRDPSSSV